MKVRFKIFINLCGYGWNVRRKKWYMKFPFLPVPPMSWLLWRLETAWGIDSRNPKIKDFPPLTVMVKDVWKFGRWLYYIQPHSKKGI